MEGTVSTPRLDRNREVLIAHCRPNGEVICPRCAKRSVYALRDGRFRCKGCVYTFHDFTGRWINRCNLSPAQWMAVIRLFVDGVPVTGMSAEVQASYETTLKAVNTLRLSIMAADPSFLPLLDQQGKLRGHCQKGRGRHDGHCLGEQAPVFGLKRLEAGIAFHVLPRLHVQDVLATPLSMRLWRTLIYTDRFKGFEALFFACCSHLRILLASRWTTQPVALDRDPSFKDFAEFWLTRYRCFAPECCPLYLKEMEFRFNHPPEAWLPLLTRMLCSLVPNRRQ